MVNFGFGAASILGICLAVAGAALYFLRSVRPELSRDHDIFFAAVGLLCGFILLFQGWRLDPILQFGQLLLTGSTVFFAVESIRLRSIATEQAKRNTPIVDEERRPSRVYRTVAELDELPIEDDEERYTRPQIRGSRERLNRDEYEEDTPRRSRYRTDEYEEDTPRRANSRTSNVGSRSQGEKPRRRTSTPVSRNSAKSETDEWSSSKEADEWSGSANGDVGRSPRNGTNTSSRPDRDRYTSSSPRKKNRSAQNSDRRQQDESSTPEEYVDYQPVEHADESDNSANFDDV